MLVLLAETPPLAGYVGQRHYHDLGKLMLAFVMFWAYVSFSQYLIIWSGNLPEEIPWYLRRLQGGWGWVGVALILSSTSFFRSCSSCPRRPTATRASSRRSPASSSSCGSWTSSG